MRLRDYRKTGINLKIIENYVNRPGKHCGSTSIRDVCEYNGLHISEACAFGLDGNLGFQCKKQSNGTIFVGGLKEICKGGIFENLGISSIRTESKDFVADSWEKVKQNINKDIPVIIQTDMFYLTYFTGIHSNFPGHVCVIVGYDDEGTVYISERQGSVKREENGYCKIKLEDLAKAIDYSKEEDHSWLVVNFADEVQKIDMKKAVVKAIYKVSKAYTDDIESIENTYDELGKLILEEQKKLRELDIVLEEKRKRLRRQYFTIGTFINDAGTGGGLFRRMYAEFLGEVYQQYFKDEELFDAYKKMGEVAECFYGLGEDLKNAFHNYNILYSDVLNEKVKDSLSLCRKKEREAFRILYCWSKRNISQGEKNENKQQKRDL